ncbi:trypsin 3A1 [Zeugodacus cucurbitae]|uniref:trypsin 3A1 n=1 Tax=Zeugodacus cucurbitae TaxID=28588 RepID=UPI0023D907CA|nr:trypsin 3A1 [Zeugodacus cucurbitae]
MSPSSFSLTVGTVSLILSAGTYALDGTPQNITDALEARIINGQRVTIDQYPYLVAIRIWGRFKCGGSIISRSVVLTAAHCLAVEKDARNYSIIYGQTDIEGATTNIIQVKSFTMHPQYDNINMDYDAGMLFLTKDIPFGQRAQCIKLAVNGARPGRRVTIAGWGKTQAGVVGDLHAVHVNVISPLRCTTMYKNMLKITSRMLCAGVSQGGKDACKGDSGGPLVAANEQVGICSYGFGCGLKGYPGVYSNVVVLRNWILNHVDIRCSVTKAVSSSKGGRKKKLNLD